jgi:hypothetical protein
MDRIEWGKLTTHHTNEIGLFEHVWLSNDQYLKKVIEMWDILGVYRFLTFLGGSEWVEDFHHWEYLQILTEYYWVFVRKL